MATVHQTDGPMTAFGAEALTVSEMRINGSQMERYPPHYNLHNDLRWCGEVDGD